MAKWLDKNCPLAAVKPFELVRDLARLTFAIPDSQGGGTFKQGQTIICKGVKPRLLYVVYEGQVRECSLISSDFAADNRSYN